MAAPAAAAPMPIPATALGERSCELLLLWLKREEAVDGITLVDGVMGKLLWLSDAGPAGMASCEFETGVGTPFNGV